MQQNILEIDSLTKYYGKAESQTKAINGICENIMKYLRCEFKSLLDRCIIK